MKKILSKPLDIHDYILNDEIEKLAEIVAPVNDAVKTALIPQADDIEKDIKNYALVINNNGEKIYKFAMCSPELVTLNLEFLSANANDMPEEFLKTAAANLTCAAKKYKLEIPNNLEFLKSARYTNRNVNLNDVNEVAWIKKIAEQQKKRDIKKYALHGKYPVDTPEQIKKASEWFDKNYNKLSVDDIKEFSASIQKEAEGQSYEFSKKAAVRQFFDLDYDKLNPELTLSLKIRKSYLSENDVNRESYDEILEKAAELNTEKVAAVIEFLDNATGLNRLYGQSILHPLLAATGIKKEASTIINGKTITKAKLDNLDSADLAEIIGNDAVRELRNDSNLDVFNSFPSPLKHEISKLL